MVNEGTSTASKTALFGFTIAFLLFIFCGFSLAGACSRGAMIALGIFLAVKVIYHIYMNALIEELTDFWKQKKGENESEGAP